MGHQRAIWATLAVLSMPWAWANTWQVCTWDAQLTQASKPWQEQDWVEKTRFDTGEVAAMAVDERQAWEVVATLLRTNGSYTEPCEYAVGRTVRMVLWPDANVTTPLPAPSSTLAVGQIITVQQSIPLADVAAQVLNDDAFYLQAVAPVSDGLPALF